MKPVIVLVGRPNVGKSTFFNRLTRSHAAVVADEPGVTRDRQYGDGVIGDRPYLVVDTGGIVEKLEGARDLALAEQVTRQTRHAIDESDAVLFLTDTRSGLTPPDREIAQQLRRSGRPVWLVVNKCEGMPADIATADFQILGLGAPHAVSASHGEGVAALMAEVLAGLPRVEEEAPPQDRPRIAVIGRPNAGKSTLINALLGEERMVVSDLAGTTRDAIEVPLERNGRSFVLIDTAGMRRRARIDEDVERHSVVRTLRAVERANVVVLVLDAVAGISDQDASLGGYVLEQGRAIVLAVNKWDALDRDQRDWIRREVDRKLLPFLSFAEVHYLSAKEGGGIKELLRSCGQAFDSAGRSFPTSQLNRILERAVEANPPPMHHGRRARPKFAHQAGTFPPTIRVHGNQMSSLSEPYQRYLASAFREALRLTGTPVRIDLEDERNPYAGKKHKQPRKSGSGRKKKKRTNVRKR